MATKVVQKEILSAVKPNLFQVLLLNDDYTTMEFVVVVLMKFFSKSQEAANALMLKIHKSISWQGK